MQPKIKKSIPISIITGTETIFIKGKLNKVATSYFETSQKIQKLYKEKKNTSLKNNSKPKINKLKYTKNLYNNTFNVSIGNSHLENKKQVIKVTSLNNNKDKINSFSLKNNSNLNTSRIKNKNNTLIIKDEMISYKHMKSITNNNLSKDDNNGKKNENKTLRQIRKNMKKTIAIIVNNCYNSSVGKNKEKNYINNNYNNNLNNNYNKKTVKKNLTFSNNYLCIQVNKKELDYKKEKSLEKNNKKIIKNQEIEKKKKILKQFFIRKKKDFKPKENIKEIEITKQNIIMNKSNISFNNKINLINKNSNNKSTAITTSRTETSSNENLEKKFEKKKDVKLNKNSKIKLTLIEEHYKKNSIIKNNDSLDFNYENSFENIKNVISIQSYLLDEKKFSEYDNFDDLNSIVKKLPFEKIEKESLSIFSIQNNNKYHNFSKKFNKLFDNANIKVKNK